jgi:hypothetical protein
MRGTGKRITTALVRDDLPAAHPEAVGRKADLAALKLQDFGGEAGTGQAMVGP